MDEGERTMSDPPAFTHASNLPSQVDAEFMAEAGQPPFMDQCMQDRLQRRVVERSQPRRPFAVPLTVEVKAHSPEHARQIAAYCAKDGFGARAKIEVGEPRE